MGETLQKQVNKLLSDKLAHTRWVAMFLCLAILVGLGTTAMLRETGVSMTHTEKVLDCQLELPSGEGYADYVVHVHNDDCYDADGNLVCQLPEIPAHVHTEDCYTTERILICGQEEAG